MEERHIRIVKRNILCSEREKLELYGKEGVLYGQRHDRSWWKPPLIGDRPASERARLSKSVLGAITYWPDGLIVVPRASTWSGVGPQTHNPARTRLIIFYRPSSSFLGLATACMDDAQLADSSRPATTRDDDELYAGPAGSCERFVDSIATHVCRLKSGKSDCCIARTEWCCYNYP